MTISKLFIEEDVAESPIASGIRSRLCGVPAKTVTDATEVYRAISSEDDTGAAITRAKEILFLTTNKGAFVRSCPGTREYTCCGYKILHIGTFCTMDCSYCILQAYFHPPVLQYFINQKQMIDELSLLFDSPGVHRVGHR